MNRIIKRTILPLLLSACLLLSGCHTALHRQAFEVPAAFDESRTYEISFWAKTESNVTQANIYKDAIASFEEIYPNIRVSLKLYTDYGRIYQDVITSISTDSTPNVCITYPDHIATYLTGSNCVVPLDTLLDNARYGLGGSEIRFDAPTRAEMIPQFLNECILNGQYYALPYMRSTEVCYVNKTYVERLGYTLPEVLTWDFVWEVSEAALARGDDGNYLVNGQPSLIPFIYKSTDNMMIQLLRQMDAGYSSKNGDVLIFSEETKQVLTEIAEHVQSGAFSTFKISSYPANWLNAGQCIFAVDSTAGSTWMGSDAPLIDIARENMVDFETQVMLIPQIDPASPQMISQGPSMCLFNKQDPQEVLASWIFMQYLLTNDVQIAYSNTEGYVPVTSKAQESAAYAEYLALAGTDNTLHYQVKLDATQLLIDHVDDTFVTPVFDGSTSLRDAAGQMIEEVAKGIRRKKTVDDAFIDDLYARMATLYRLKPADTGPLPPTAVALLTTLAVVWVGILLYLLSDFLKRQKRTKNT
ncbi:MAG: extracellular solute-binding protein [Aristaeellaceae bacterium]